MGGTHPTGLHSCISKCGLKNNPVLIPRAFPLLQAALGRTPDLQHFSGGAWSDVTQARGERTNHHREEPASVLRGRHRVEHGHGQPQSTRYCAKQRQQGSLQ